MNIKKVKAILRRCKFNFDYGDEYLLLGILFTAVFCGLFAYYLAILTTAEEKSCPEPALEVSEPALEVAEALDALLGEIERQCQQHSSFTVEQVSPNGQVKGQVYLCILKSKSKTL